MHIEGSARRRGLIRIFLFAAGLSAAAVAAAQAEAPEAAASAAASAAQAAAPGAASAPAACPACPMEPSEAVVRRLDGLLRAVEAAASAPPPGDRWQDAKAVVLNVISSRLDDWLFGAAGGHPGWVAQGAAFVAFVFSALKFLLAWAQRNPPTRPGPWGRFKEWARTRPAARAINVVLSFGLLVISAAGLYVVTAARSDTDGVQRALGTLDTALQACQAELVTARARPPAEPLPATAPVLAPEALEQLSASCDRAITATQQRLDRIQQTSEEIAGRQPWAVTKLAAVLAMVFLVVFAARKW